MGLLQQPIERRLSAMLGAQVTFEKLNVSLLGGSVEAQGVVVAGEDPATPVLTIRRLRAEIALGAALKKEIVVKSLTIEKPVLTIARGVDGRTNLPTQFRPADGVSDTADGDRQTADDSSDVATTGDVPSSWKLEARKVLIVDGEVHFRDASGFHASAEQLLAELNEQDGAFEFTLIADSVGRRDQRADLGQLRAHGRADSVPSLVQWQGARAEATVELADMFRGRLDLPSLSPLSANLDFNGSLDLSAIPGLLPPGIGTFDFLRSGALKGRTELAGRASYRAGEGLRIPELTLRAIDLVLSQGTDPGS